MKVEGRRGTRLVGQQTRLQKMDFDYDDRFIPSKLPSRCYTSEGRGSYLGVRYQGSKYRSLKIIFNIPSFLS